MSATELDEVQALLERVLPDPTGYAQRLLLQAMTRWGGQVAEPGTSAFYTPTAAEKDTVGNIVITPDQPRADETPVNTNILLAAALGACECWGLRANCSLCWGQGSPGWTQPDPELFEEFVVPAIAKLPRVSANGLVRQGSVKSDDNYDNHQTVQGGNA